MATQPVFTISLQNVHFRAYHGLYPQERVEGNDFIINLAAQYSTANVQEVMARPVDLLETVVQQIAQLILTQYPQVLEVRVSLEKTKPPIADFNGSAVVEINLVR
jgi:7,8-dihydroneopterin aldolase/epimerase/oxygenase